MAEANASQAKVPNKNAQKQETRKREEAIREKGKIEGTVIAFKMLGVPKDEATQKLVELYHLSIKNAEYYYGKYK